MPKTFKLPGSADLIEICTLLTALALARSARNLLSFPECEYAPVVSARNGFRQTLHGAAPCESNAYSCLRPPHAALLCSLHAAAFTFRMSSTPALPDVGSIVFISTKPLIKFVDPRTPLRMYGQRRTRQTALTTALLARVQILSSGWLWLLAGEAPAVPLSSSSRQRAAHPQCTPSGSALQQGRPVYRQ